MVFSLRFGFTHHGLGRSHSRLWEVSRISDFVISRKKKWNSPLLFTQVCWMVLILRSRFLQFYFFLVSWTLDQEGCGRVISYSNSPQKIRLVILMRAILIKDGHNLKSQVKTDLIRLLHTRRIHSGHPGRTCTNICGHGKIFDLSWEYSWKYTKAANLYHWRSVEVYQTWCWTQHWT